MSGAKTETETKLLSNFTPGDYTVSDAKKEKTDKNVKSDSSSNGEKKEDDEKGLNKKLGVWECVNNIIACIVGSGIFLSPSLLLGYTGSVGFFLVIWVLCGIITIIGGLCFAELGTLIPESGAEYNYIDKAFGGFWAFMYLWCSVLIIKPVCVTIIALTFAIYVTEPFFTGCEIPDIITKLLAALCIIIVTAINLFDIQVVFRVLEWVNYVKLAGILMIVGLGCYGIYNGGIKHFKDPFAGTKTDIASVINAFFQGLWAYDGWNNLNYGTEEMINPEKTLPNSITIGMAMVTVIYFFINVAYIGAIGAIEMIRSPACALTVGTKYFSQANIVIPILVAISTFGSTNATVYANARLLYVAERYDHVPKIFGGLHATSKVPVAAIIFESILSLLFLIPSTNNIDRLIGFFNFACWVYFGLCFVAQIHLRDEKKFSDLKRSFNVPIFAPIFMILVSIVLVVLPVIGDPIGSSIACALILSAAPVYFAFIKYKIFPEKFYKFSNDSADWIGNFLNLEYDGKC